MKRTHKGSTPPKTAPDGYAWTEIRSEVWKLKKVSVKAQAA